MKRIWKWISENIYETVIVCLIACLVLFVLVGIPCIVYGQDGASYQVAFGNISAEQCHYVTTGVGDISFLKMVYMIDPCSGNVTNYAAYQVTWKTNAEGWLKAYFAKDNVSILDIRTFKDVNTQFYGAKK